MNMRLRPEADYVYVEFSGAFELEEALALSTRFIDACVEHQLPKVLVDTRQMTGQLSITERFQYANFVAGRIIESVVLGRLKLPQLAYVGAPPIIDPEEFGVVVALNRGVHATTAGTMDEALKWLGVGAAGE